MEYRDLLYAKDGHIATITLNRPDRLNAISLAMLESFSAALREADADHDVRVIILTGAGRGFCAGLDLKDPGGLQPSEEEGGRSARFDLAGSPPVVLHKTDKPVICALNGAAVGYGFDMALGCDIRIASEQGRLGAVFTKRAIVPESGGTWLLPRLVGWAKACELAFRGAIISAEEALRLGLVNAVVPHERLMTETQAWAEEIAGNAPLAVQATKRMMRLGLEESFEASVHHVYLQLLPLFASQDFIEGIQSFMEKRRSQFKGR